MIGSARALVFLTLAGVLCLGGCAATKKMDVRVSLDERIRTAAGYPTLEVDLIGVNPTDVLRDVDPDEYFAPGSEWRRNADNVTLAFSNESPQAKGLRRSDKIWSAWRSAGATDLLVLVDHLPQSADPRTRRLLLTLDGERWVGDTLEVVVFSNMLRCTTEHAVPEN